jgi:hypothetical protein
VTETFVNNVSLGRVERMCRHIDLKPAENDGSAAQEEMIPYIKAETFV